MTLYLWILVGVIVVKLSLSIPLLLIIRESNATIRRLDAEEGPHA